MCLATYYIIVYILDLCACDRNPEIRDALLIPTLLQCLNLMKSIMKPHVMIMEKLITIRHSYN